MNKHQDKYSIVTEQVYNSINIAKGITVDELITMLPQVHESFINRAIYRMEQEHRIYKVHDKRGMLYYTNELPF